MRDLLISPTPATRFAVRLSVVTMLATAAFLVVRFPSLPSLLPVHFTSSGLPNGWQFRTLPRVLMPVYVQLALATTLGAVAMLLLSRTRQAHDRQAPDVRAALAAAEAVSTIASIWVIFQAYAAVALVAMWTTERGGLGRWYAYVRAHARAGRPAPRPYVAAHWRFGQLYVNQEDPALFVPTRQGARWTLNFGRPVAAGLLGFVLLMGVVLPTVILGLMLR
jgi:uncharacterized membrane protein